MQVLCAPTDVTADIHCPICDKGFRLFWERNNLADREAALPGILQQLCEHHEEAAPGAEPHPESAFNIPSWSGLPQFSGAALLGGAY